MIERIDEQLSFRDAFYELLVHVGCAKVYHDEIGCGQIRILVFYFFWGERYGAFAYIYGVFRGETTLKPRENPTVGPRALNFGVKFIASRSIQDLRDKAKRERRMHAKASFMPQSLKPCGIYSSHLRTNSHAAARTMR